jgi:uncharacterized lipoprotein YmbA
MKNIPCFLIGLSLGSILAGCASKPSHFYSLDSTVTKAGAAPVDCAVLVGPVFIPAAADRPQFTVVTAPNRVEIDEFNRWNAPLSENVARVVSGDLSQLLGTPRVAVVPMPDIGPAYRVTLRLERFESARMGNQNGEAIVDAIWVVRNPAGDTVKSGSTDVREPAQGSGYDALAAAHSRALAKVSSDIAAAIRAAVEKQ